MIEIRKVDPRQSGTLLELAIQTYLESHAHAAPPPDTEAYVRRAFTPDLFERELADERNVFHFLYVDGELAGYSKLIPNAPQAAIPADKAVCRLERIYIRKEFYGRRAGHALLQFNIERSKELGQSGMWLGVWVENDRAIQFYRKAGFEVISEIFFQLSETRSNPNHVMYLEY